MQYDALGRMVKRTDEDQTRWFYDKYMDGSSSAGMKGKLAEVIIRPGTGNITSYDGTIDNRTVYIYDTLGRPVTTSMFYPKDATAYVTEVKYDTIGRAYETRDGLNGTVFTDSGVQTHYNSYGYAYRTVDVAPLGGGNGVLSEIKETNARGQVAEEWRNNGNFVVKNEYYPLTGLLKTQKATTMVANLLGTTTIQDESYGWVL